MDKNINPQKARKVFRAGDGQTFLSGQKFAPPDKPEPDIKGAWSVRYKYRVSWSSGEIAYIVDTTTD